VRPILLFGMVLPQSGEPFAVLHILKTLWSFDLMQQMHFITSHPNLSFQLNTALQALELVNDR
jgi:hypothetical protein